MPSNLIENRTIRVFISSTFRDMQDERDELMKKTFPMLRQMAAERDVTLTELDLRWGITPEESESGKVVEICLREIENSTPFFVGIIGNRYGWIPSPSDLGESLRERFSQVDGYVERHLSVTEMEMQFGVLERPEELHAFFFIKERETDDADEPEKLAALKAAVRSNGRYPVSTYSSPEDLANQVEAAFTKLLDELYPEGALSELEKERVGQRAYLNSLCQNYIRTDANFAAIDGWVRDWERHQLVITGASGLGKSALVANWVKEKLAEGEGLPYRIIYHFVGNGGSLGSHGHVIKALCDEIRDRYRFEAESKEDKTDEKALEELFNRVAAEGDKPLLIVLDAINQIIDVDNSKQLNWLPIPPKKVKILFTTLEDDRTMEVFRNRHYPIFTLQPLTKGQRVEMVKGYLGLYSKKLQPHQIERIVTDSQCENTLVLKTLLDELINFGIFEKLDEKIGTYLDTESVEEFYGILLKGYEADFSEPLVKHVLSLIAVSRNGLSEEEILSVTKETPLHWSQFFCAIRQHLIVKNGLVSYAHSYIRKAVEERYLQGKEDWENACRKEIVAYFNGAKSHRAMDEVPYQYDILGDLESLHEYLMDLEVFVYLNRKEQTELGKYWRRLIDGAGYSLEDYLPLTEDIDEGNKASILAELGGFTISIVFDLRLSRLFLDKAYSLFNGEPVKRDNRTAKILNLLGVSFLQSGENKTGLDYLLRAVGVMEYKYGDPFLATIYDNVGIAYRKLMDYDKALKYHNDALDIKLLHFGDNHSSVAMSYNNIGAIYGTLGDNKRGLEYLLKALKISLNQFGENHCDVAYLYGNIGHLYGKLGDDNNALEYKSKALKIRLSLFNEKHPEVAHSYDSLGYTFEKLGNNSKALEYQLKALEIKLSLFDEKHPDIAHSYDSVGRLYGKLYDHSKALDYLLKALDIWMNHYGENHPYVAESYRNIGVEYGKLGDNLKAVKFFNKALGLFDNIGLNSLGLSDHNKALFYFKRALEIRLDLFDENHPDVALSYDHIGYTYDKLGDNRKAIEYLQNALDIWTNHYGKNHPHVAESCRIIGVQYGKLGDNLKALEFFNKALEIFLMITGENSKIIASTYNNIGIVYSRLGEDHKALEIFGKALDISKIINDEEGIATYLNRIGRAYKSVGQTNAANEYFFQAAEQCRRIGNQDQVKVNLDEIISWQMSVKKKVILAIPDGTSIAIDFDEHNAISNWSSILETAANLNKGIIEAAMEDYFDDAPPFFVLAVLDVLKGGYAKVPYVLSRIDDIHDSELLNNLVRVLAQVLDSPVLKLTTHERIVIERLFGIGYPCMTLEAIGQYLNLSSERTHQIKEKAIRKIKSCSKYVMVPEKKVVEKGESTVPTIETRRKNYGAGIVPGAGR